MNEFSFDPQYGENAVPIKVSRIFDSCSDKDCFSDLPVTLEECSLPAGINILRSRSATVQDCCVSVEPVPFNRGFYQLTLTFTFALELLGYERTCTAPEVFNGTAFASKTCILYGSESSVRTFVSGDDDASRGKPSCCADSTLPTATVSVLEPIVLETRIGCQGGPDERQPDDRGVYVTLGLFSVAELSRPVTLMVPTLDYSIPRRECCNDTEAPCEIFSRLRFPEDEFLPPALGDARINEDEEES